MYTKRVLIILIILILSACNLPPQTNPTPSKEIEVLRSPTESVPGSGAPTIDPTLAALQLAIHPSGRRTGQEGLDRIIDAVLAHDYQAIKDLTGYLLTGCEIIEGLGGPPSCQEGEAEGTIVEVVPFLGPEGHHQRREKYKEWQGPDVLGLLAAYKTSSNTFSDPNYPAGDYGLLFLLPGGMETITLHVEQGKIIRYDYDFGGFSPVDLEEKASEIIIPLALQPVPTAVPWNLLSDPEGRFSLLFPPTFVAIENETQSGWIIDDQIRVDVLSPERSWITCFYRSVGDCPFVEEDEIVFVNNVEARRISGYIGSIGGNIPQDFLTYIFPIDDMALVLTVYALPLSTEGTDIGQIWPLEGFILELFERTVDTVEIFP